MIYVLGIPSKTQVGPRIILSACIPFSFPAFQMTSKYKTFTSHLL